MLGSKRGGAMVPGGTTLVSHETTINGDLHFSGNLEIEGQVKGNVIAEPGKEAMVRIVAAGRVEGEIRAPMVMINGAVEGVIYATRHLELASSARVIGDVYYSIVEMAAGAEINGRLLHRSEQEVAGEPARIAEPQLRVASTQRALAQAAPAQPPPAQPPAAKVD